MLSRKSFTAMTVIALSMATFGLWSLTPSTGTASSHRDAPLILEDPFADNTDVYAFVSSEPGRQNYVTLIANFIPLEEPGEGPNYYRFSDNVLYEIKVDLNGDAVADMTYQFDFTTTTANGNTFLYNTGKIGLPGGGPSSQYTNLNVQQSYTLTEVATGAPGPVVRGQPVGGVPRSTVLLQNARVAPINVGPRSTGSQAEYEALAAAAVHTIGTAPNDIRVFAGPRDEGFYVDLMGNFDLLNIRNPGVDTTSGFNVHTIALEIPKSRFAANGDTDGIIGVWATASRPSTRVLGAGSRSQETGSLVQVSRLGNPLVNEVLVPLRAKDGYNFSAPANDATTIRDFIVNPATSQGSAALIPLIAGLTGCTPTNGRTDLELALLKGIDATTANALAAAVPSLAPFAAAGGNQLRANPVVSDMIRLNYNVPPTATPSRLGFFGGDPAGFPNGRRVGDDVLDIDLIAAGGGILHVLGAITCPAALTLSDNVDGNDVPYLTTFPYLGTPHQGYSHVHDHD